MKAIVVFDVNEFTYEAIKEYFTGVITLHLGNDRFIDFKNVALEPMPRAKQVFYGNKDEINRNAGWNECLNEILGIEILGDKEE